ncbi:hypothetical protein ACFPIK_04645 [Algoriphagus aquatilis]|uniref:3-keto-disaccharide hydrolase domain-containing protein n=1 Tax=Algoriphagus aquatilis TaxID=490186 RepID=A0ABW0BV15_9BACT
MINRILIFLLTLVSPFYILEAQTIRFEGKEFSLSHVKASVVQLNGEEVLRVVRDMDSFPFEKGVDEPTFVKLTDLDLENGSVGVKVLSRLLPNAPAFSRGFIGLAYRINDDNSAYESIYIRPTNGRAEDQIRRNHSIQYYAYPEYKFDRLRKEFPEQFETYADMGLDEWITMRIEFDGKSAKLFLNGQEQPAFLVKKMLGSSKTGSIGLWVEVGTEGFFKELKINP